MSDTIDYKGYKIGIEYDEYDQERPLEWSTPEERGVWFVMSHKKYNVPNDLDVNLDEFDNWQDIAKTFTKKGQVYKFVNWYEHGDIALSLVDEPTASNRWDAGIAGLVIADDEKTLQSVFTGYKMYMAGEIYSYMITDEDDEIVDSRTGIYGYEQAIQEALDQIDYIVEHPPVRVKSVAPNATELHK